MTVIGVVAGLGGALAFSRVIASMLYGLKPWDPTTLTAAAALLILGASAESWVPAGRAAAISPTEVLRHE